MSSPQDAQALLRRASKQLSRWHEKYGEHQPAWLPPAGDVELQEDIDAALTQSAPQAAPQDAEPIGHLHSNGDFCQERMPAEPPFWPVPLYTRATTPPSDEQKVDARDAARYRKWREAYADPDPDDETAQFLEALSDAWTSQAVDAAIDAAIDAQIAKEAP